jgi:hypothetical protein
MKRGGRRRSREEVRELLIQRSVIDDRGCWVWQGAGDGAGYALLGAKSLTGSHVPIRGHVATWLLYHGDRPEGYHIHHTCETKKCVNPSHLEIMPARDHAMLHHPSLPDECQYGHRGRIRRYAKGDRQCLECMRLRKREARARLRNIRTS